MTELGLLFEAVPATADRADYRTAIVEGNVLGKPTFSSRQKSDDFAQVSGVLETLEADRLPGILALFFPGEREGNTYRFLGARTGWNYLATPILTEG